MLSPKYKNQLLEWHPINHRLLACLIQIGNKEVIRFIVVYGPGENDKTTEKEYFWEKLQEVYDMGNENTIILSEEQRESDGKT